MLVFFALPPMERGAYGTRQEAANVQKSPDAKAFKSGQNREEVLLLQVIFIYFIKKNILPL